MRNTWWVDFRFGGERYRKRSPENSRAGALAYEAVLRGRLTRGEPLQEPARNETPPTFETFAWRWYDTYVRANNRLSEQINKRCTLRVHLVPWFGRCRVNEITGLAVEEFKTAKLKAGLSPKTINNYLSILGRCLRHAEEWLNIDAVPKIKQLRVPPQKFDYLSFAEAAALLDATTDLQWHAMVLVALRTGLRLGELKGLQWNDVDLERSHLTVHRAVVHDQIGAPKNNRERQVPFTSDVRDALLALDRTRPYVFGRYGYRPLDQKTAEHALREACRGAGLRHIGWHTLRHTFASHLAMKGVSMKAIQELLGHSHMTMTMRYAHLAPSTLRDAVSVLEPVRVAGQPIVGQRAVNALALIGIQKQKHPELLGVPANPQT
jgi:integrase